MGTWISNKRHICGEGKVNPVKVVILGSQAPYPGSDDLPSTLILWGKNYILLDVGEGVQSKLLKVGVSPILVKHILVTHLHGDHVLGLLPLLQSRSLGGSKDTLTIVGPKGIKEYVMRSMQMLNFTPMYDIEFVEINKYDEVLNFNNIKVYAYPLMHTVPTIGFTININNRVKVSYITDTRPLNELPEIVYDTYLLIHDATFSHTDLNLAKSHFHSTSVEAALTALKSRSKLLILYHISPRYKDQDKLVIEARRIFPHTYLAKKFLRVFIKG